MEQVHRQCLSTKPHKAHDEVYGDTVAYHCPGVVGLPTMAPDVYRERIKMERAKMAQAATITPPKALGFDDILKDYPGSLGGLGRSPILQSQTTNPQAPSPVVTEIQKLNLGPDDILVVTVPASYPPDDQLRMNKTLVSLLRKSGYQNNVVVKTNDIAFAVINRKKTKVVRKQIRHQPQEGGQENG